MTTRKKGHGQLAKERPFSYGRLLRLDYEDSDSSTLILLVDCSMGVRKMYVFRRSVGVDMNRLSLQLNLSTI